MKKQQQSPIWPYLGILACLFVLSITAPRAWDRMARQETLTSVAFARKSHAPAPAREPNISRELVNYEEVAKEELTARASMVDSPPVGQLPTMVEPPPAPEVPVNLPGPSEPWDSLPMVEPAKEFAEEVREPNLELANRPRLPTPEPAMDAPQEETAAEPAYDPVVASSAWPLPRVLVEQLIELRQEEPSAVWAEQANTLVHELCRPTLEGGRPAINIIKELREVAGRHATAATVDAPLEAQIARVQYGLTRWLDIWESAVALDQLSASQTKPAAAPERIAVCLADVDSLTRKGSPGAAWRDYLKLEGLRQLANSKQNPIDEQRRAVARQVLERLSSQRLSQSQQRFVSEGPLATLQSELRSWAAEPVTSARLLAHLEQYERTGLASDAQLVANDWRGLNWSAPSEAAKVSGHLETHYRNANFRVAIAGALLNRMVPQPKKIEAPVNDTVVNVPVVGHSTTFTKLFVRLVPDARRIRLGLEASGVVASDTVSMSGPAKFYNEGKSTFLVRKLLVLGPRGLSVWPAVSEAENNYNYLVSLETDFDGVPLVGSLVRSIARSQHDDARDEARMEVEQKVGKRARDQLDAEVRPHLVKAAESVEKRQMALLNRLGMELVPLELSTTEERIVARMRLAGSEQLGAHTPRPRAPSDSWFSLQLHQSALNNALEKLDLNGREFSLEELFAWLAEKLDRPQVAAQDDLPDDVRLTFAKQNAVQLRCEADRVEVTFALADLAKGGTHWRNFTVRTFYRPEPQQRDPRFTRDGSLFFEGKSVKGKPLPVLRGIFSKVLSRNRDLHLLDEKLTSDPRLNDLDMTQFVVEDGWIGLAYSPRRAPDHMARRPKK